MKRKTVNFIVNLISWTINMLVGIGVIIVSTKMTECKVASTVLLIVGLIDAVLSFIVLAIFVPYKYYLDKSTETAYKKLRADYYKEIFKEAKQKDNEKAD